MANFIGPSLTRSGNAVWHVANDGSTSGLDADLLDGYDSAAFPRLSVANNFAAAQTISSGSATISATTSHLVIGAGGGSPNAATIAWGDNTGWTLRMGTNVSSTFTTRFTFTDTGNLTMTGNLSVAGTTSFTGAVTLPSGSYATPALTLGTANAAGSAATLMRSDATIALFDTTAPTSVSFGTAATAAAVGSINFAARRDHTHAFPAMWDTTVPALVALATTTSTTGSATVNARRDHTHGISGTLPIANGGTNSTATATAGGIGYGTGTAHAYTAAGTSRQVLISNAASAPSWATLDMTYLPDAAFKKSVRVASTANIAIATALVNASVIDGITVATGDRVLLKNQTTAAENGIYVVVASGAASRATDADTASEIGAAVVAIDSGTTHGGQQWATSFKTTDTLGTTAMNWSQIGTPSFAAPGLTLGTANAAGSAITALRSDATIALFDTTAPTSVGYGGTSTVGSIAFAARRDHTHAGPATPVTSAVAGTAISVSAATGAVTITNTGVTSNVAGTGITVSAATGAVTITNSAPAVYGAPGLTLGTTNAEGTGNAIRTGATLALFDTTAPTTVGYGGTSTVGSINFAARRDHTHAGPATPVTSAVAGTGIGVSAATGAVTITNNGVTSAVAGTNISVSAATGAVTINFSGTLPIASGGTGSTTQNFVDLTTAQTGIGGVKTFTAGTTHFTNSAGTRQFTIEGSTADALAPRIQSYASKPLYINELGNDIYLGPTANIVRIAAGDVYAQSGTGNQVRTGVVGSGVAAGIEFGGATNFMGTIAANRIGIHVNSVKTADFQETVTTFTTPVTATSTGATAASRYAGGTSSGAPTSGLFNTGDFIVDQTGKLWVCTAGGSPGTWVATGGGSTDITQDPMYWMIVSP